MYLSVEHFLLTLFNADLKKKSQFVCRLISLLSRKRNGQEKVKRSSWFLFPRKTVSDLELRTHRSILCPNLTCHRSSTAPAVSSDSRSTDTQGGWKQGWWGRRLRRRRRKRWADERTQWCASTLLRHVLALDRTRVSLSHQHFLLSLCLLFCFTFIPFYPAVRHFPPHTEKTDLCKGSSSQFLVILTSTLFFLTSSKPFSAFVLLPRTCFSPALCLSSGFSSSRIWCS